ncbi:hypothetical protein D3C87_1417320 [compost metagenome]
MAAFTRHGKPSVLGVKQACNAKTSAGAKYDPCCIDGRRIRADLFAVAIGQAGNCERLSLEVVEDEHRVKAEFADHFLRPNDPVAIGQIDFVAVDRTGNGKNCRTRLGKLGIVEDLVDDRVVDCLVIRSLHMDEVRCLAFGIDKNGEAGICAADISDQDRKGQCLGMNIGHGERISRITESR